MKKKILPLIALLGTGSLLIGCTSNMNVKKDAFISNLNAFKEDLQDYTTLNEKNLTKTAFNKYNLSIISENLQDLQTGENNNVIEQSQLVNENFKLNNQESIEDTQFRTQENINTKSIVDETVANETNTENLEITENENDANEEIETIEKISTLYSLSSDIEDSCDEFCELKEEITEAIIETQNLIEKLQQKELELTKEQRMFITEQSMQLKNLGRQLSNITTELAFNLSDLNQVMAANGENIDNLNLKYLVVLDNLVNGNEMLQSSLSSLNLINQMFNMRSTLPPNNQGRVLYGFKHNDNPAVIKDYYIDENGELIDNSQNNENSSNETNENAVEVDEDESNVDTYQNKALKTNIDTYNNVNTPRNIDSFFNTALLDNEFMYGNGGYGYGGMYGAMNPYMQNYANYERNNTNYGNSTANNTQNTVNNNSQSNNATPSKKERKRIQLKKNIDTYKDENEPDIKTKLGNIKSAIYGFFGKFKKSDLDDKIDNPISRYEPQNEN